MASGKVARRTAVGDVVAILESPEVAALIAAIEAVGDSVSLHADLTMLARLSQALSRAREVPLAA